MVSLYTNRSLSIQLPCWLHSSVRGDHMQWFGRRGSIPVWETAAPQHLDFVKK